MQLITVLINLDRNVSKLIQIFMHIEKRKTLKFGISVSYAQIIHVYIYIPELIQLMYFD